MTVTWRFVLTGLALVWCAGSARAAAGPCADSERLATSASARLGRSAAEAATQAGVRFTIDDSATADAPAVEVTFTDEAGRSIGRRVFAYGDSSCQAALDAAAVSVALFLQERDGQASEASAPAPEAPPPLPVKEAPRIEAAVASRPVEPAPAWSPGLQAGALVGGGDVPWGTLGVEVTVRGRKAGWPEFFAGGAFWPEQQPRESGVRLSWTRADARAGLCPLELRWQSRRLAGCAALTLGRLTVEALDLNPSSRQSRWMSGADASLGLAQWLHGRWFVGVEARLVAPFQRSRVDVADGGGTTRDLFRASLVGAAGLLSFGYSPVGRAR